jgi:hypothetical protein
MFDYIIEDCEVEDTKIRDFIFTIRPLSSRLLLYVFLSHFSSSLIKHYIKKSGFILMHIYCDVAFESNACAE